MEKIIKENLPIIRNSPFNGNDLQECDHEQDELQKTTEYALVFNIVYGIIPLLFLMVPGEINKFLTKSKQLLTNLRKRRSFMLLSNVVVYRSRKLKFMCSLEVLCSLSN